jgi:aminoglycoside 6'-N-acetyltransferase I
VSTEIRVLAKGDEQVLRSCAPEVFDDPIDVRAAAEFLADPRHHVAVAVEDGVVVGFVSAVHYVHPDKSRPEMWVNEVGVAPTHQGRGLGKALLGAVLGIARELGCAEAWVLTDRSNAPAMRLYASLDGEESPDDQVMFTFHVGRHEDETR